MKPKFIMFVFSFVNQGKHQGDVDHDEMGRLYAEDAIKVMDQAVAKGRKVTGIMGYCIS